MERRPTLAEALTWAVPRHCPDYFRICSAPPAARPEMGDSKGIIGMSHPDEALRVAFVVKRYPRYSETFVVREILAHERAGLEIEIFSLHPSDDTHFQDLIARVRAPVHQLPVVGVSAAKFWTAFEQAREVIPDLGAALDAARGEQAGHVYQALRLAHAVTTRRIHHLHAPFAHEPTSVARLASRFTGVPYSFTARARDI